MIMKGSGPMSVSANTYQCSIKNEMEWMALHPKTVFLGEGLINAGRIYNTLDKVPTKKCIEYPICENLIVGSAIGLAIAGYRPIVIFQRMDFMLLAMDAIINHLCLIPDMSGSKVRLPVIIRAIIGSRNPKFDVGPQHNKDLRYMFRKWMHTIDYHPGVYKRWHHHNKEPVLIVEDRDKYESKITKKTCYEIQG